MKTIRFTFLTIFAFALSIMLNAQCANTDNVFRFLDGDKRYELVKESKTWTEASACAVERGGYLVQIDNQKEQTAVYDGILASEVSSTYTSVSNGGSIAYIWIGGTDKKTEGTWLWDGDGDDTGDNFWTGEGTNTKGDGVTIEGRYVNWGGTSAGAAKEPDDYNSNQDGAAIALAGWPSGTTNLGIAGEWNDIITSSSIYYIIEYNAVPAGLNIYENEAEVSVFPNPSNGIFKLFVVETSVQNIQFEVFSIDGSLIQSQNLQNMNTAEIDLSGNPGGIYYVRLYINNKVISKKICLH